MSEMTHDEFIGESLESFTDSSRYETTRTIKETHRFAVSAEFAEPWNTSKEGQDVLKVELCN